MTNDLDHGLGTIPALMVPILVASLIVVSAGALAGCGGGGSGSGSSSIPSLSAASSGTHLSSSPTASPTSAATNSPSETTSGTPSAPVFSLFSTSGTSATTVTAAGEPSALVLALSTDEVPYQTVGQALQPANIVVNSSAALTSSFLLRSASFAQRTELGSLLGMHARSSIPYRPTFVRQMVDPAIARLRGASLSAGMFAGRAVRDASDVLRRAASVGQTQTFSILTAGQDAQTTSVATVNATLGAVSTDGYIWVDPSLGLSAAAVATIASDFENAYASDTEHFGTAQYGAAAPGLSAVRQPCDASGNPIPGATPVPVFISESDPHINVVVVAPSTMNASGYFSFANYFTPAAANCLGLPTNQMPMIVVSYDSSQSAQYELQEDLVRETAHELQHLINFVNHAMIAQTPQLEDTWINEGLSTLAQDFAVQRMFPNVPLDVADAVGQRASAYLAAPQNYSVTTFAGYEASLGGSGSSQSGGGAADYNCTYGCYGASYLFMRYLYDRFGGDAWAQAMETGTAVSYAGLQNATGGVNPQQLLTDFGSAIAISGTGITNDARYVFQNFNPYGTYVDQFGNKVVLNGPATTQLSTGATTLDAYDGTFAYGALATGGAAERVAITDETGTFGLAAGIGEY